MTYRLSKEADRDVEDIARHTIERWGWSQAEAYLRGLHDVFETLAAWPELGRRIDHIRPGYRRFEHVSHSVFYVPSDAGVTIIRILHRRMRPVGRL